MYKNTVFQWINMEMEAFERTIIGTSTSTKNFIKRKEMQQQNVLIF